MAESHPFIATLSASNNSCAPYLGGRIDLWKTMTKQLLRIAPWQAGKVFAVIYFCLGFILNIPLALTAALNPSPRARVGPWIFIIFPIVYALFGLLFMPLCCWIYNSTVRVTGGLKIAVTDLSDA
jgi:hypothetical protein